MNDEILRLVKYVFATVEHGSMRKAALALGTQESSISRHIAALEQQMNVKIFERSRKGVALTDSGRKFLETVKPRYKALHEALAQVSQHTGEAETLRIGLSAPIGREFLLRLIERFQLSHSEIDTRFRDGTPEKHANAVRVRELDVAFMCGYSETSGCHDEVLFEERFAVLLPEKHPCTSKTELLWSDLGGERLLVPLGPDGPAFDPCLLGSITANENPPLVEHCQATQATVLIKVQMGKGFTVSDESIARAVTIKGTTWRPITGPNSTGAVKIVWLDSNPKRAVLRFVDIAKNMARGGGQVTPAPKECR